MAFSTSVLAVISVAAAATFMLDNVRRNALSMADMSPSPYISIVFFGASQPWKPTAPVMPITVLKRASVEIPPPRRASSLANPPAPKAESASAGAGRLDWGAEKPSERARRGA